MKPFTSRVVLTFVFAVALVTQAHGAAPEYKVRMQPMPHEGATSIGMDYIAFDPATGFLWAPAGNTAAVDVVDTSTGTLRQVPGFKTAEMGSGDRKRMVGPSSVTIGAGTVYVGNRGHSSVFAFHARSLARGVCHPFDSMPAGILYLAAPKPPCATPPRANSLPI